MADQSIDLVARLDKTVSDIQAGMQKSGATNERLSERCNSLEKSISSLHRTVVIGNGQPSLIVQITELRTQLHTIERLLEELRGSALSEGRLEAIVTRIGGLEKSLETQIAETKQSARERRSSRTTLLGAIIGVVGSLVASLIALWNSLLPR